jgi:mannose-1-phosphate guanylyltransferase
LEQGTLISEKVHVVVVAGGQGKRLYPISNDNCAKQFCALDRENTFIQATAQRFIDLGVDPRRVIVIVTTERQYELAEEQLCERHGVLPENILQICPDRDFAGAMMEGTRVISEKGNFGAIVISTPADHYIEGEDFGATMVEAVNFVDKNPDYPVIIGVEVDDLNTMVGCGHAIYDTSSQGVPQKVCGFIEKPDIETARQLLERGDTACNTGITVWNAGYIRRFGEVNGLFHRFLSTQELCNSRLLQNLHVIIGEFKWMDCGTLKSLRDINVDPDDPDGNVQLSDCRVDAVGSSNCLFFMPPGYGIEATHLTNIAVVASEIGNKIIIAIVELEQSQLVKQLAESLVDELMEAITGVEAHNNVVSPLPDGVHVGFVGVSGLEVAVYYSPIKELMIISVVDSSAVS